MAEGKPIPTELRRDEQALRREVALEDDNTAVPRTHIDDEYAHAGERDPQVLVTTSRDPSSRLTQFAKELKLVLPNAQRINRGSQVRAHSPGVCQPGRGAAGLQDASMPHAERAGLLGGVPWNHSAHAFAAPVCHACTAVRGGPRFAKQSCYLREGAWALMHDRVGGGHVGEENARYRQVCGFD